MGLPHCLMSLVNVHVAHLMSLLSTKGRHGTQAQRARM